MSTGKSWTETMWWENPAEIARLLRWLHETEGLDVEDLINIVEKPHHWGAEWLAMCAARAREASSDGR